MVVSLVELSCFPEPEYEASDVLFFSDFSDIRPGCDIIFPSTTISPLNIFTTVDMDGRSFGICWVQRSEIFTNLLASSRSKSRSPSNDTSINSFNLFSLYSAHAYIKKKVYAIL